MDEAKIKALEAQLAEKKEAVSGLVRASLSSIHVAMAHDASCCRKRSTQRHWKLGLRNFLGNSWP